MEQTIVSLQLPVQEALEIRKNRIAPPAGQDRGKRICIVTGVHGDELEGQYVIWELTRRLNAHPECLHGTVDLYPAVNPLGINSITRGVPLFDLDMNRIFPGTDQGHMAEYAAMKVMEDIQGADAALDIHASNIFLRELPQVRVNEASAGELVPLAKLLNVDFVWIHAASTVLESTLAHSLNAAGTRCLVVEMGVGMRITQNYGNQLIDGIFALMKHLGLWDGPTVPTRTPIVSRDEVAFINASEVGIFLPAVQHNGMVQAGQTLGVIADPLTGGTREMVTAPAAGLLFTLREYPVVYPGSLLARILKGGLSE